MLRKSKTGTAVFLVAFQIVLYPMAIPSRVAARAAEIKVLSAFGIMSVIEDLAPKFERVSGHKLIIAFDGFTRVVKRVQAGETVDVVVIPQEGIDDFVKNGKTTTGNVTVIARAGIGVIVRSGAPNPNISSSDALKRALLAAKSVAYPDPKLGGPTGIHFDSLLDRLGIRSEMKPKTIFPKTVGGISIATMVAKGEAELGVHQIQELLPVAGIELVGPLPNDLQKTYVFAAAVMSGTKDFAASKALINFLRTPEAAAVIKAKGMVPD